MDTNYSLKIARQLSLHPEQVSATISLLDAENTLPFIARYRKEATGGLDEEQLRQIIALLGKLRTLDERRQAVMASIEEQGKMTPQLQQALLAVETLTALEDLYQPYKPKRRTRASVAREKGLEGLAELLVKQPRTSQTLDQMALPYLSEAVPDSAEAWAGARDIVAEMISDHAEVRRITREKALQWGVLSSERIEDAEDPKGIYQTYYEFESRVDRLRPHQVLALNRGEQDKVLRIRLQVPERDWKTAILSAFQLDRVSPLAEQMALTIQDAAERLLLPAIERDVRRALFESSEIHAIHVFGENLRALLSQPPLAGHTVLGIDPGFRTGCKVAVVDPTGKLLECATIYPHEPQNQREAALKTLASLIRKHHVSLITIGNGTASRETEALVAEFTRIETTVKYMIVNEAGASVYSASPLARSELPELDVSLRGAVSIARRAQDPLAELVKIDPKSIGVGMYQHDVDQKELGEALNGVVESVVNAVGVDVNTASPALLNYVAGIGPKLAGKIVAHRDQHGPFSNRLGLQKVSGLGPKAFEQSAGFLRIQNSTNPLDGSAIHPESYPVALAVLAKARISPGAPPEKRQTGLDELKKRIPLEELALELDCGLLTLADIIDQLARPGRDPRQDTPAPILRSDVLKMEDLVPGMQMKGTVRNVVDFGAFIDIGVKQDGLLHRTQLPPNTVIKVGDIILVKILNVEIERGRIALGWVSPKQ